MRRSYFQRMSGPLLTEFTRLRTEGRKGLAVLVDPDKATESGLQHLAAVADSSGVDFIFVGGSLMVNLEIREVVPYIKSITDIPVVLFPGSLQQIVYEADALLFLSLISGRNPELLIGAHVLAAPMLKRSRLEVLPTGYMLVDAGKFATVHYISNTQPIPYDKPEIAACTAMAGELLGLRLLYLDAGSGAPRTVSPEMVAAVARETNAPLIVGGGIRSRESAIGLWNAGADVVVIGNHLETEDGVQLLHSLRERPAAMPHFS